MTFPQYISTSERTVSVVGMIDKETKEGDAPDTPEKYQDGKGYIDEDEKIWIFSIKGKPKNANEYPYFWFNDEGKKEFSDPPELIRKAYSTEYMVDMSLVNIVDTTKPGEVLYNEEELNDMNAAAAVYTPVIYDYDDFLKKIVKTTIIEKGIDINRLKCKTGEKYILPNMKAALQNKTKMSVVYFNSWMNLLGCDFEITILDNNTDTTDRLKNPLVYQSYRDKTSKLVNGELVDTVHITSAEEEEESED